MHFILAVSKSSGFDSSSRKQGSALQAVSPSLHIINGLALRGGTVEKGSGIPENLASRASEDFISVPEGKRKKEKRTWAFWQMYVADSDFAGGVIVI